MPATDQSVPAEPAKDPRCGFVAIVGRPNVGKSTLLNHILGQKLSITSRKPQTTRHQVHGIKTVDGVQAIYVDTPGIHVEEPKALNRYMNRAATSALAGVDLVIFVVDRTFWNDGDENVLQQVARVTCPVILAVNKVDQIETKSDLLPHLEALSKRHDFAEIIPLSALKMTNVDRLEACVASYLPAGPFHYPDDQWTTRSGRFLAAEMVREKVMRQLGAELPYSVTVQIEQFKDSGRSLHIHALIIVERDGQKKIIIGDKGARLRQIGQQAREDMERLFERKVMLNLWIKVRKGWSDDDRALRSLGFDS
ncbi:GTPase Era [Hydrocarboniclastica marina]|uniref:GTPase Era n=1 Tax=Hydrocarboniclastica marina TaxID=2259620 RepID=A0A4P7XML9_9ALTE|nr:GTPase Era [Hydrocarboniclastica marina]QCF27822.1 GTPase Era [Hydrocarboniclastica marina]